MSSLGIADIVEVGAGKVLCGLARRIDKSLNATNIQEAEDVERFLESL